MSPQYIIERHKYGWLVKPPPGQIGVPMHTLKEIKGLMPKNAVIHPGIGKAMKATFAIGTPSGVDEWSKEIEEHLKTIYHHPLTRWLNGTDTGLSSRFMAHKIFGGPPEEYNYPHDSGDFGRCMRLLDAIPADHNSFVSLSDSGKEWAKLILHWGELVELYRANKHEELTQHIRNLLKE